MSKPDDHDLRPRRRFSLWSLLAPAALVVVVVAMYTAINKSDVVTTKGSSKSKSGSKASKSSTTSKHTCAVSRGHRVRAGETFGSIAKEFCLPEDTLKACNPELLDPTNIQPGDRLTVGKKVCAKAAAAPSGVPIDNL